MLQCGCGPQASHAIDVQRDAMEIVNECGAQHVNAVTNMLSTLASNGRHPGNAERDLYRMVKRECELPIEPYDVDVTILGEDGRQHEVVPVPIALPHEVFAALRDAGVDRWKHSMTPSIAFTTDFWRRMATVSYMADHPIVKDGGAWPTTIPVGVWGDGAQFNRSDSATVLSWNSLLAPAHHVLDNRFLIGVVPTANLLPGSLRQILAAVSWSLAVMWSGQYPSTDHLMRPWPPTSIRAKLAGKLFGARASVIDFRGDWSWQSGFWGLPYWHQDPMCLHCLATQNGDRSWSNFSAQAPWRYARISTHAFLNNFRPGTINPLAFLPGFDIRFIRFNEMHTVKLGLARLTAASALLDLCQRGVFGPGALPVMLAHATRRFKRWCRSNHLYSNLRRFTKSRLGYSTVDYPELGSKAWNTRIVISWLAAEACGANDAAATEHTRQVAVVLHAMHRMFQAMESSGRFFEPAAEREFCDASAACIGAYMHLAAESLQNAALRWPMRPKMHGVEHIVEEVRLSHRNPKYMACMLDEDFVGLVLNRTKKGHRRTLATASMIRYCIKLKQRWSIPPVNMRKMIPRTRRDRPLKACL